MEDVAELFEQETGRKVTVSAAASNTLARQLTAGSPGHVFLSANQEWANSVREARPTSSMVELLTNELILITPKGNPSQIQRLSDLTSDRVRFVAIGGEGVPLGQYATHALEHAGIWSEIASQGKVVRGQDSRATLAYVLSGEVAAGIVYASDVQFVSSVEIVHRFKPESHPRIVYSALLLQSGDTDPHAQDFFEFLQTPSALAQFERHGFKEGVQGRASSRDFKSEIRGR